MSEGSGSGTSVELTGDRLSICAGQLGRTWVLGGEGAATDSLTVGGRELPLAADAYGELPECVFDGLTIVPRRRGSKIPELRLMNVETEEREADAFEGSHRHVTAEWREPYQNLRLRRSWSVYPGVDAVVGHAEVRSESRPQGMDGWKDAFENIVDSLPLDLIGWQATAVRFYGRTDYHNEYVKEENVTIDSESADVELQGNLLFLTAPDGETGLFILHEAPPENEKRPECSCTFRVGPAGVRVLGWGVQPHEVRHDRFRRSYSVAIGCYRGGEHARREALRRYLKVRFPFSPVEQAVVANPWGDGDCYGRFNEQFLIEEIAAAEEVGATHYQIDDGWQAGGTLADLTCNNCARPRDYWNIHPEKLPQGFSSLLDCGRKHGIGLALWFAPDVARGYRNWEEERDILLEMHRTYDIDLIKIDGIRLYTKDDEEGVVNLMTSVTRETNGRVRFNLDVTNGMRLGYFANQRFGTIFVENRYVIGKPGKERSYLPWRVLRNLWQLAKYVPPEKLQFEFANLREAEQNANIDWDRSTGATPLDCSWEYAAAVTLMASPLCWLQPSRVPAEARPSLKRVMDLHQSIASELAHQFTFPIGQEPDGASWTGFRSYAPDSSETGLVLVYRENCPDEEKALSLAPEVLAAGTELTFTCLSHDEPATRQVLDENGAARFAIPERNDYRLYRYAVS